MNTTQSHTKTINARISTQFQSSKSTFLHPAYIRLHSPLTKLQLSTTRCHNSSHNTYTWIDYIPGNSWWNLEDLQDELDTVKKANPVTVSHVLIRIWKLVEHDKLTVYIGFGSLAFAAV